MRLDALAKRKAQRPKPLEIDFCIDARGVGVRVSEHLADLRQGSPGAQQLTGQAVAEQMCPSVRKAADSCTFERRPGNHRDGAPGGKADVGRQDPQKQPARIGHRSILAQVGNDGRADIGGDWHA